ncbi:MAG TPA: S8 family serine peptidase, partial [Myxococcota bacterium]|nr:S8 family serine peptidase [Myxococcota bacterium]
MKKPNYSIVMTLVLICLLGVGLGLFFLREAKMPWPIGHEITIQARKSTQRIITDQFLILVSKNHVGKLDEILAPLALELKMPILNWLLVEKRDQRSARMVALSSEEASESALVLNSLQKHPHVLDAQHNFILDPADIPNNRFFSQEWQLQRPDARHVAAMNLPTAWAITQGADNLTIGVVDQFKADGRFTFRERFSQCQDRIEFFAPSLGQEFRTEQNSVPHGEPLLLALGACNNRKAYSAGIDSKAAILAANRPSLGHAQTFVSALLASHINPCDKGLVPCPKELHLTFPQKKPDILLLPFGSDAPELLQFTTDMTFALRQNQIIVVTAAGNNQSNAQNYFPGGGPDAINVGALGKNYERAPFSNWGPRVDLLAPGAEIAFIYPNGDKKVFGTSL